MPFRNHDSGHLISIEGISGVGKTYLTNLVTGRLEDQSRPPVVLKGFSDRDRAQSPRLGDGLLSTLITAARGDPFLRGGHPGAETLLLLAIKMFDYEAECARLLAEGRTVIEGRSIDTIAVYQSLIAHHDGSDEEALSYARRVVDVAAAWRPLPDRTILIVDDVGVALARAGKRDGRSYSEEESFMHRRASNLYQLLALSCPSRVAVLDRRGMTESQLVERMITLVENTGFGDAPPHCPPRVRGS